MRLTYFLIAFVCLYSLPGLSSSGCKFIKLKACNQIQFLTLDIIYICNELVSFHSSKLDETILQSKIQISNYELLRCDRNRNGGGVSCYVRSDIGYVQKRFFPREIENIFVEILLPKTKSLIVGIIYRPPNQSKFLRIINANFDKLDTGTKESYVRGDFNINMYIVCHDNTISSKFLSGDIKNYHQFCRMHGLQ